MAQKPFSSGHILAAADVNDLVGVYDRSTSEFDLVNTASGDTMYSKEIAANHLSTDRMARLTVLGDYLNNTGGAASLTWSLQFGGTVLFGDQFTAIAAAAGRRQVILQAWLANLGATNVQVLGIILSLGAATAGSVGIGDVFADNLVSSFNSTTQQNAILGGSGAKDSTGALTLAWVAQHGSANANLSLRKRYACLELL